MWSQAAFHPRLQVWRDARSAYFCTCILLTGLSDHNMILVVRKLTKKCLQNNFHKIFKPGRVGIPKSKMLKFENDMKSINWDDVLQIGELDKNSETVIRTIEKAIQKYTQLLKCRQNASLP